MNTAARDAATSAVLRFAPNLAHRASSVNFSLCERLVRGYLDKRDASQSQHSMSVEG